MNDEARPVKIAILCPGPSLLKYFPGRRAGGYDVLIAVNGAATCHKFVPDWWACLDLPLLLELHEQVPACGLLTNENTRASLERRNHERLCETLCGRVITTDELLKSYPGGSGWTLHTMTAAMVLARSLQKETGTIDVYGCDWTAEAPDFDGRAMFENRSAARFEREREIVAAMETSLGIKVVRVQGSGFSEDYAANFGPSRTLNP